MRIEMLPNLYQAQLSTQASPNVITQALINIFESDNTGVFSIEGQVEI